MSQGGALWRMETTSLQTTLCAYLDDISCQKLRDIQQKFDGEWDECMLPKAEGICAICQLLPKSYHEPYYVCGRAKSQTFVRSSP